MGLFAAAQSLSHISHTDTYIDTLPKENQKVYINHVTHP